MAHSDSKGRLVLYKMDASPPCNAVRMLGEILGLEFELKDVDFFKKEQKSPEFMKLNPMGTVPTLQDGNFTISESHAIIYYLLNKYGGEHRARLYPADPETRALVDQCLFFDTGVMFIRLKVVALPIALGIHGEPSDAERQDIETAYGVVEAYLDGKNYLACNHLTIADICLGSSVTAIGVVHKLDAKKFPRCKAWIDRLEAKPYFQKINAPGVAVFDEILQHNDMWKAYKDKNKTV